MVITVNEDCTEVTLTSDILLITNQSVEVTVTYNCTTDYVVTFDATTDPIVITPSDVSMTDSFTDGVYNFKLVVVNVSDAILTESKCQFINCNSTCLMLDTYKDLSSTDKDTAAAALIKVLSFEALLLANNCSSCSCTSMCALYNATGLDPNTNATDCGCQ